MNQFLELANEVLLLEDKPLVYQDIWEKAVDLKIDRKLNSNGKTPWQTLGARLFVDVRDNENSKFIKVGKRPAKFFLKEKQHLINDTVLEKIEQDDLKKESKKKIHYLERELHPLLSYFAYTNSNFNRGKAILTKTIFHEKSKKAGLNEWTHPDIVGVYIPIDDWNKEVIELNNLTNANGIKIYSFELKRKIDRNNYREIYFQAVSNSSWANEGYLVAAEIREDDELMMELDRLSTSFGIGIILLDLDDIDASKVLYHAEYKKEIDWETVNKLSDINSDYRKFLQDIRIDFESSRIHKAEYDQILDDPEKYIKKIKREGT